MRRYPGKFSRPGRDPGGGADRLKKNYTDERRILDCYRGGTGSYRPAKSLEVGYRGSVENRSKVTWATIYKRIAEVVDIKPEKYVRYLFFFLRGCAVPIPAPNQLASAFFVEVYESGMKDVRQTISNCCRLEAERAKNEILALQRRGNYPLALVVRVVTKSKYLGLSPLFCYQLFLSLKNDPRVTEEYRETVEKGCNDYEEMAMRDYELFESLYDSIYGNKLREL